MNSLFQVVNFYFISLMFLFFLVSSFFNPIFPLNFFLSGFILMKLPLTISFISSKKFCKFTEQNISQLNSPWSWIPSFQLEPLKICYTILFPRNHENFFIMCYEYFLSTLLDKRKTNESFIILIFGYAKRSPCNFVLAKIAHRIPYPSNIAQHWASGRNCD